MTFPSLLLLALAATTQDASGGVDSVQPPSWISAPRATMPDFAGLMQIEGDVDLRCQVTVAGQLEACEVLSVRPDGLGFRNAALASTGDAELTPRMVGGVPQQSETRFTIRFRVPDWDFVEPIIPYTGPPPAPRALDLARQFIRTTGYVVTEAPRPVVDVEVDRRDNVQAIVDSIYPSPEEINERTAVLLTRILGEDDLQRLVAGEPVRNPPADELLSAASSDLVNPFAWRAEIRARYCAAYDCSPPAQ
jgi:hypothetical protein